MDGAGKHQYQEFFESLKSKKGGEEKIELAICNFHKHTDQYCSGFGFQRY